MCACICICMCWCACVTNQSINLFLTHRCVQRHTYNANNTLQRVVMMRVVMLLVENREMFWRSDRRCKVASLRGSSRVWDMPVMPGRLGSISVMEIVRVFLTHESRSGSSAALLSLSPRTSSSVRYNRHCTST